MYTTRITFATLSSLGATAEENGTSDNPLSIGSSHLQNPEVVNASPSNTAVVEACSPKSVYALASKVIHGFLITDGIILTSW